MQNEPPKPDGYQFKPQKPAFSEEPIPFFPEERPFIHRLILAICALMTSVLFIQLGVGVLFSAYLLFIVYWFWLYHTAPIAVKYLTTLGLIAVCLLSLTSTFLLQSRENARQNRFIDDLREFGRDKHERSATYPNYAKQLDRALKKKDREDPNSPLSKDFFDRAYGFPPSPRDDR